MLISRKQSTIFRNSDKCIAYWYKHNDKDLDISYAEIKGEYPTTGFTVNKKVKEMIYIVKGTGEITTRGKKYKLKKDDTILIQKKPEILL